MAIKPRGSSYRKHYSYGAISVMGSCMGICLMSIRLTEASDWYGGDIPPLVSSKGIVYSCKNKMKLSKLFKKCFVACFSSQGRPGGVVTQIPEINLPIYQILYKTRVKYQIKKNKVYFIPKIGREGILNTHF